MQSGCLNFLDSKFLYSFSRFVSWFGDGVIIPIVLVLITATFFWIKRKDKNFAIIIAVSPFIGQITKWGLKNFFQVLRPESFGCQVLTTYRDKYAFPSGHTIFYTIFFGLLIWYGIKYLRGLWYQKPLIIIATTLIVSVGFSRLYLGAHWIPDVIIGHAIGGVILLVAILINEKIKNDSQKNK